MSPVLDIALRRAKATLRGFTPGQIGVIAFGIVALAAVGLLFSRWSAAPYTPLFSNLATADASAVVEQLTASGVPYQLENGGATIMVPQDQVYSTRLSLSAEGLPASSQDGYSLLDKQGITTSEFMQNVTYQRAVEGELAKTIQAIDGVESATVHLALPEKSVFTQDSDKPTASVMVATRSGTTLDSGQVQSITNLVSASVPKLTAANVTVADSTGLLLSGGTGAGGMAASTQTQVSARTEATLSAAAQTMLDRVVGSGNSAVRVHADLDFDTRETTTNSYSYTPGTPPISSSNSTETYTGTGTVPGGVVGSGTTTSGGSSNNYNKSSTTQNNSVGSTTETRTGAPGAVKRLTVAVLVNANAPQINAAQVSTLVANAVGLDTVRGDTIQVTSMPFDTAAADAAAAATASATEAEGKAAIFDLAKKAGVGLLVLAILVLAFLSTRKQRRILLDADALASIGYEPRIEITRGDAAVIDGSALVQSDPEEARAIERAQADISELVARQPDEVAQLLRGWISSGR